MQSIGSTATSIPLWENRAQYDPLRGGEGNGTNLGEPPPENKAGWLEALLNMFRSSRLRDVLFTSVFVCAECVCLYTRHM